jgi:hypothetical protein
MKIIIFLVLLFIFINLKNQNEFFSSNNYQHQLIEKQPIKKIKYNPSVINEEFKKTTYSMVLFQIKNNKVKIVDKKNIMGYQNSRIKFLVSLFEETLKNHKINDILFLVNVNDNIPKSNIPFLGCVYEEGNNCLAIPINWCHYFGTKDKLFEPKYFDSSIQKYRDESFSLSKKNKLTSKIIYRGTNNCPERRKLASFEKKYSNLIDVKLARNKKDKHFIDNKIIRKNYDKFFCIRGMGKWTGSLNQFALADGILFIIEENCKQPFELLLEPMRDYVNIKRDFSDFENKIKLSQNTELMLNMRNNMKKKTDFFNSKNIMEYIYLCINNLYL